MLDDWHTLPQDQQAQLASAALAEAMHLVVRQAESLADSIEIGLIPDSGGVDALRLLVQLLRAVAQDKDDAGHS